MRIFLLLICACACALLANSIESPLFVFKPADYPGIWQVKSFRGQPNISVTQGPEGSYLRLRSDKTSFAVERPFDVDVLQYPYLTWRWQVTELPRGGDFRVSRLDDQAAQLIVAFQDRRILTYLWDTTAPRGAMQSVSVVPFIKVFAIVCRSGADEANRWLSESRNIAEDFEKAYGRKPVRVKGVRFQINSQHTATSAESHFGEVAFRKAL